MVAIRHHAVADDFGIAVALLVIFGQKQVFVLLVFIADKLLGFEDVPYFGLFGALHGPLQFEVGNVLIATEVDAVHLNLVFCGQCRYKQ